MQVIAQAAPCGALAHGVDLRRVDRAQVAALREHWLTRDKRCLVHAASGGYDGHQRLLHRITVAERATLAAA